MDLRNIHKRGLWPLLLSGMALIALVRTVPDLRREYAFAYHSERTLGWVTHKDEEHGRSIHYAYRSDGRVYGGRYEVGDSDSDFSFTNPGDAVNVIYLTARPYVSDIGDNPVGALRFTQHVCVFWAFVFLTGLFLGWFLTFRRSPKARSW